MTLREMPDPTSEREEFERRCVEAVQRVCGADRWADVCAVYELRHVAAGGGGAAAVARRRATCGC